MSWPTKPPRVAVSFAAFRVVLIESRYGLSGKETRYILERKNGTDALQVERWTEVNTWTNEGLDDRSDALCDSLMVLGEAIRELVKRAQVPTLAATPIGIADAAEKDV